MADLDTVTPLADTVLFEGYVLYPYRANDAKNQVRFQWGVLMPPAFAELDPSERAWLQTAALVEGRTAEVRIRLRFLHVRRRTVHGPDGAAVSSLEVGNATYLPCDEAEVCEVDLGRSRRFDVPGGRSVEPLPGDAGSLVREWEPLIADVSVTADDLPGPYGLRRVRVRVDNRSPWASTTLGPSRPDALRRALVAAHLVLGCERGTFVSQLDPPEWARGYVQACDNVGVFPVLAGPADDLMLASPIILYDHAEVAPESAVAFCDATEMDEMLTLRAMTLTDEEKRAARGSDPRAAGILDQVDHLPPELTERLHGAIRSVGGVPTFDTAGAAPWWDPGADASVDPDSDEILVGDAVVRRGVQVRLKPGGRRADAQDMFLQGRLAHVEAVLNDVDGNTHLAVALDDLVQDGLNPHGRFLYFAPDEVEVIS